MASCKDINMPIHSKHFFFKTLPKLLHTLTRVAGNMWYNNWVFDHFSVAVSEYKKSTIKEKNYIKTKQNKTKLFVARVTGNMHCKYL